MIPIALKVYNQLPDPKKSKTEDPSDEGQLTRNLNNIMRILDAIGNNESQFEQLDFLISRFEKLLRKDDYLRLLNINQCARLFRTLAHSSHKTLNAYPLLDQLTRTIHKGIDSLRESDVIAILKAY